MLSASLKVVVALVLGVIASAGVAAADLKIGFVSTERVLRESAPAVRSQSKLKREFEKREADLAKMERQIQDLQTACDRDCATMSETERNNKVRELSNLKRDYQRNDRSFREDVNSRKNEELASLQERADKIIKQIADVEKFDLILQEPVVWASPRIDITDRVIKLLADK
jgi:outer membrane protein